MEKETGSGKGPQGEGSEGSGGSEGSTYVSIHGVDSCATTHARLKTPRRSKHAVLPSLLLLLLSLCSPSALLLLSFSSPSALLLPSSPGMCHAVPPRGLQVGSQRLMATLSPLVLLLVFPSLWSYRFLRCMWPLIGGIHR